MAAKKFYGVAGKNGYGVYDDYGKVLGTKPYVKEYKVKGFRKCEEAEEYAVDMYGELQYGASKFNVVNAIHKLNWFYYKKPVTKPMIKPFVTSGQV